MTRKKKWLIGVGQIGIFIALVLVCLELPTGSIWGQDDSPSLGDLARKERERKKAQSAERNVITNDGVERKQASPDHAPAETQAPLNYSAPSRGEANMRDAAQTEKQLRQIVKEHPLDAEPRYLLGSALTAQNRMDEALAEFRTVVELNPRHRLAWGDMGVIYQRKHDLDKAAEAYKKAIESTPTDERPNVNLCSIYLEKGQNDKTAEFCEAALKVSPGSAGLWNNLAWLYATAKDPRYRNPAKALEYAEKGVALSGATIPEMLDTLAMAYSVNLKWAEAIEAEKKALKLRPGDASFQQALVRYQHAK